jgi:hypothetical protein
MALAGGEPLYPRGKCPQYLLDRRLGGPESQSGHCGEEKILDPTRTRTSTPQSSSLQPVAIPTTLSWLLIIQWYAVDILTASLYRVSQEEWSVFWEVIITDILSKKCIFTCVLF